MSATRTPARKSWINRLAGLLGLASAGRHANRPRVSFARPQLELEQLGGRELLSATVSAVIVDGVLEITGTDKADVIALRQVNNRITIDGVDGSFDAGAVLGIVVDSGGGNDLVSLVGSPGEVPVQRSAIVMTGEGDDVVYGGGGGLNAIDCGAGNDVAIAGVRDNLILGGDGNDALVGSVGSDILFGGSGNDTIYANYLSGSEANILIGDDGDDTIHGGGGTDHAFGKAGRDRLYGNGGNDRLEGGADDDTISGGAGHDRLVGNDGGDVLAGGTGVDVVSGGVGADRLYGDGGTDLLLYDYSDLYFGTIYDTSGTYYLSDTSENLQAAVNYQPSLVRLESGTTMPETLWGFSTSSKNMLSDLLSTDYQTIINLGTSPVSGFTGMSSGTLAGMGGSYGGGQYFSI